MAENWPVLREPNLPATRFRIEFTEVMRKELLRLHAIRRVTVAVYVAAMVVAVAVIAFAQANLLSIIGPILGVMGGVVALHRRSKIPVEAPAVLLDRSGLEIWTPDGEHLALPWAAIDTVRAGTFSIGLTLSDAASPDMAGVEGLGTRRGDVLVRGLADPTASPLMFDTMSGYRSGAFAEAVERLSAGRVKVVR